MDIRCFNCDNFITCPRASEEIKECNDYKKIGFNVEVKYESKNN